MEGAFPLQPIESSEERVTYLDTFDWRLMDAGLTLTSTPSGGKVRLTLSREGGESLHLRSPRIPAFARDLEDSPLRTALGQVTKVRRLLPQARAAWSRRLWAVLNEDQKTVARILIQEGSARVPADRVLHPVPPRLRLIPLKGYAGECRRVASSLKRAGVLAWTQGNELAALLEQLGVTPERHSSSSAPPLTSGLRAEKACRIIHRELLATMQVNLDGVLKDLDSEFLHEFRVAGRRARSALTQVKGVFPDPVVTHFKEEFRWLGTRTGPTRDMDVYLLKVPSYQEALPDEVKEDLIPLVGFLERRKGREHRRLVRSLTSKRFAELVGSWSRFLETDPPGIPDPPPNAQRPVDTVASERIIRVYRRILRKGGQITPRTPAEALHRLRIDCKQLRYLISLFQSLFPPEALAPLIEELKKLQDNLGDFNDLQVQRGALHSFAEEMMATGVGPPATLMAMGQLMGRLDAQQAMERKAFHKRFRSFARKINRQRFEELFG